MHEATLTKSIHDVKPRVEKTGFARRLDNADAQAQKLSPANPVWQKHCRRALAPEFDPGKAGGKGRGECAVCSKPRSRGIFSQPANAGPFKIGFALQLE